nr:hypothetical protein [Burkholderia cepacia]
MKGVRLPHRRGAAWMVGFAFTATGSAHAHDAMTRTDNFGRALPRPSQLMRGGTLYLELVVNALPTGQVVPVRYQDGAYYVRAGDLAKVSVRAGAEPDRMIDLAKLDGVEVEYDSTRQRLALTVPPDWLPRQTIGSARLYDRTPAAVSFGMLFNYDVYTSPSTRGPSYTSALAEQRLFDRWGTLSNTGATANRTAAARVRGATIAICVITPHGAIPTRTG